MPGFDPSEFAAFKGGAPGGNAAPPPASPMPAGGFNPAEFDAFKGAGSSEMQPAPAGALHVRVGRQFEKPMSTTDAALVGAERGATFGFGDEGRGVAAASTFEETAPAGIKDSILRYSPLVAIGRMAEGAQNLIMDNPGARDRYGQAVEENRGRQEQAAAEHPGAALGGELAGGLASAVVTPMLTPFRAAQGAGLVARAGAGAGNLAATGAAYGGLTGLGTGEGDMLDRLPSAATGAGIGAAAGPVIGGAAKAVGGGVRFLADNARAITSPATLADRFVGRAVERDSANLPAIADEMARANTVQRPAGMQLPDGTVAPLPDSHFVVRGVVHEMGPNQSVGRAVGRYVEPGTEIGGQRVTLADLGGENTRKAGGNVARTPGPGRQEARRFVNERQAGTEDVSGQADRLSDRLGQVLGDRGSIETASEIMARRSREAEPAFRRAYAVRLDYDSAPGQRLLSLLDRIPNEAKAAANRILKVSDEEGHALIWQPHPERGYDLAAVPNGRHWSYIKQGLDTIIEANANPLTGKLTTYGKAVNDLKRELLGSLDKLNPAYATARKAFAGESELLDALRTGQEAFRPGITREAVARQLKDLTPGEAEMYRLGAANALREKMASAGDGNNKVRSIYGSPALREKVNLLVTNPVERKALHEFIKREAAMFETRAEATGGSQTWERGLESEAADHTIAMAGKAGMRAMAGDKVGALKGLFDIMKQVDPEKRGRVMGEARKLLFDPNPETVRAFIARLDAANVKAEARRRILSTVMRSLPPGLVGATPGQ